MTSTTASFKEVDWKEYEIHDQDQHEQEEEDQRDFVHSMFNTLEYETFQVPIFPDQDTPCLTLRGQSECTNSTGLGLWRGSEILSDYLRHFPFQVKNKRVLEVGAGMGLTGLLAHRLGASHVVITDGDSNVLDNLRYNITQNKVDTTKNANQELSDNNSQNDSEINQIIECQQLIWGRDVKTFLKQNGGPFEVVLAADCVYMIPSVVPLWETVQQVLAPNGLLVYVNVSASQAPLEMVLEEAQRHGFEYTHPPTPTPEQLQHFAATVSEDEDEELSKYHNRLNDIYLFRRKTSTTEKSSE